MKSFLPSYEDTDFLSSSKTEHIAIHSQEENKEPKILISDVYLWTAPDGTTICTSIILPCPQCEYPIVIKPDQLALTLSRNNGLTLNQKIACPSRWKKMDDNLIETDEDGNPITHRCGWSCKGIENSKVRNQKNG